MGRQIQHQGTIPAAEATVATTVHAQRSVLVTGLSNEEGHLMLIAGLSDAGGMGGRRVTVEHPGQRLFIDRFTPMELHRALSSVPPSSR